MIPVLTSAAIRAADAYTIATEPITSLALMQRAIDALFPYFKECAFDSFHFICGTGNNGGDGLGLALKLLQSGKACRVSVLQVGTKESPGFAYFKSTFAAQFADKISFYADFDVIPKGEEALVVDAVFGSGFEPPLRGAFVNMPSFFANLNKPIWSIDMPSGLDDRGTVGLNEFVVADKVWVIETPRPSLLSPLIGMDFTLVPIGLNLSQVNPNEVTAFILEKKDLKIPVRKRHAHKGTNGRLLVVGGSKGMTGAPVLAAKAAFAAGAGVVTGLIPSIALHSFEAHLPEAMTIVAGNDTISGPLPDLEGFSACVIGPGMGRHAETQSFIGSLLASAPLPLVLDADALRALYDRSLFSLLKPGMVLTPHPGEWAYLSQSPIHDKESHSKARLLVDTYGVAIVLKGTYTALFLPNEPLYYIQNGNASLATAGAGDMLAGCIGALLGMGFSVSDAVKTGVYFHAASAETFQGRPVRVSELISAFHY